MSTTVTTPTPTETCAYCGARIFDHDLAAGDACEWTAGTDGWCQGSGCRRVPGQGASAVPAGSSPETGFGGK
jgi:hypothetical protein